jgi:dsRNA-specific ribonuclease
MNNPHNKLITKEKVESILNFYGDIGGLSEPYIPLKINNLEWYQTAFIHESYHQACQNYTSNPDNSPVYFDYLSKSSNENLEYVGDRVLKSILGVYVEERFGETEREGFLTKINIKIEKCSMLHKFAITLGFHDYILLSLQLENQTILGRGRLTPSIYEDAFEAFIGAIRKDFGEMGNIYAERFVRNIIENVVDFSELVSTNQNFKDGLQRFFQITLKQAPPTYQTLCEENPLYRKVFTRIVYISHVIFNELKESQKATIRNYTNEALDYYKTSNPQAFLKLLDNMNDKFILCMGVGRKIIDAEQNAAYQGLVNLDIDVNY